MGTNDRRHDRRAVLAGAAGLGLATLAGGTLVRAQDTPAASDGTPPAGTDTGTTDEATLREQFEAEAGARYDDFVTRLASNLSISDSTQVDTAIRATLTDLIDARLQAGEISANDATAAKTAIASSPAPVLGLLAAAGHDSGFPRFGGHGRPGGFGPGGRPGGFGPGGRPGDDETSDDTDPAGTDTTDATPAAAI